MALASGGGRVSDIIPFKDVAELLEKVSKADTTEKKKKPLEKFVTCYRQTFKSVHKTLDSFKAGGDSLYPIIRVLIPDLDRGRKAYGFKSSVLGRMFAQILGLDKKSQDGKSLIEFKDPTKAGASAGDISGVIFNILKSRFSSDDDLKEKLMLTDIHDILDKLAKNLNSDVNIDVQKKILQGVVRRLTAIEGKWLVRLLLKDMRLGFSSKAIVYGLVHKQAKSLSERVGDLELLCQKLNDPSVNISDDDITLFKHFHPMLSTRMDIIDNSFDAGGSLDDSLTTPKASSRSSKKKVTLPSPPFYVETKWDGERFQVHYDGKVFKYFSRRGFDYSHKFDETLTPTLRPRINSNIKSFIMDGEMMAYNKKYKIFTQKGNNIDVKTINLDNPNHCPVFVAFDLVYLNGTSILTTPLKERQEKMLTVFQPKEDVIRASEIKTMNTKEEVVNCLNTAIDDGDEGLIVKNINSFYVPGKRPFAWLKIKPEYLEDNSVDDLDLVILGAYYSESTRRGGDISHFLVGLLDNSKGKNEYFPLTTVGSGRLRSVAVKELVAEMLPKFVKTPVGNVHFRGRKRPDFMIEPRHSVVVQVKASEIIPSDQYTIDYTLRFPRIVKVRRDKSPRDIMTVAEFHRLREACGGKLAKRTDASGSGKSRFSHFRKRKQPSYIENSDDDDRPLSKRSPMSARADSDDDDRPFPGPSTKLFSITNPKTVLFTKSPSKGGPSPAKAGSSITSAISGSSKALFSAHQKNIFHSKMFCVYGSFSWKSEIETKIRKHGGNITQSPDVKDLFAIVGESQKSVLVNKAIHSGKYDVLQIDWINESIAKGSELPLVPANYWGMTKSTHKKYENEYDEYGDSYTKELTLQETKGLMKRLMEMDDDEPQPTSEKSASQSPQKASKPTQPSSNQDSDSSETDFEEDPEPDRKEPNSFSEKTVLEELFPKEKDKKQVTWNFMNEVEAAFRGKIDVALQSKLRFYGGKIAANENVQTITHVVVSSEGSPSKEDHPRAVLVTQKWLEDCFQKKCMLDELCYSVN